MHSTLCACLAPPPVPLHELSRQWPHRYQRRCQRRVAEKQARCGRMKIPLFPACQTCLAPAPDLLCVLLSMPPTARHAVTRTIWHAAEPVHQPQEGSGSNLLQARLTALRMAEKYCPTTASFLSSFFARDPREGLLPLMHLCDQLNAACVCNRSARPSNAAHGPHSRLVVSPVGASPTCVLSCVCSRVSPRLSASLALPSP